MVWSVFNPFSPQKTFYEKCSPFKKKQELLIVHAGELENVSNICRETACHKIFDHRRRINTEEKAKVVAAAWGKEFFQFLAILH